LRISPVSSRGSASPCLPHSYGRLCWAVLLGGLKVNSADASPAIPFRVSLTACPLVLTIVRCAANRVWDSGLALFQAWSPHRRREGGVSVKVTSSHSVWFVHLLLGIAVGCGGGSQSMPPQQGPPPSQGSPPPTPTTLRVLWRVRFNNTDRTTSFGSGERNTLPLDGQI